MRQNNVHGVEAGKAFADMLAQNTALKELDLSSQQVDNYGTALDAAFAKEFAVGISGNEAMTSIDISQNKKIDSALEEEMYQTLRMNKLKTALSDKSLTELDLSGICFGAEGAPLVAHYISNNGALLSLNISNNKLTRGEQDDTNPWGDPKYKTDLSGKKNISSRHAPWNLKCVS
jgi:Ran GTPase-activating protein (RanGAP) involved in mRNA processing and transport